MPFVWNESTCAHHKVSGIRTYFLRARRIPAATYIDGAVGYERVAWTVAVENGRSGTSIGSVRIISGKVLLECDQMRLVLEAGATVFIDIV